jgi:benzoyl-CoA reductase subunit C
MWKMMFSDKLVRYLDVPQNFDPEVGGSFYRNELEEIASELERRGAQPLDPERLSSSIETYNENRRIVRSLHTLRRDQPWKVPSHELYLMMRAGLVLPVEEHTTMISAYRDGVLSDASRTPLDQARVLLTGSFCEQPPLGMIKTLEMSGCYIVDDDFVQIHRWIRDDLTPGDDPLGALVSAFLKDSIASPTRYIDEDEKGRELVQRVQESAAEGVLFCAPSFCDPALLDQPMVIKKIEGAGIPWTSFKYSENTGQFHVIREQAGTFADSIKLWA